MLMLLTVSVTVSLACLFLPDELGLLLDTEIACHMALHRNESRSILARCCGDVIAAIVTRVVQRMCTRLLLLVQEANTFYSDADLTIFEINMSHNIATVLNGRSSSA